MNFEVGMVDEMEGEDCDGIDDVIDTKTMATQEEWEERKVRIICPENIALIEFKLRIVIHSMMLLIPKQWPLRKSGKNVR